MILSLGPEFSIGEINQHDMDWLCYIWHMSSESNGMDAVIDLDNIPRKLRETIVYQRFHERLTYYRDIENLVNEFDTYDNKRTYYIELSDGFLDTVNRYIRTKFLEYELLQPYKKPDALSQKLCKELCIKLDKVLKILEQDVQPSNGNVENLAEIKSSIIKIQETLESGNAKKGTIRSMIENLFSLVKAFDQVYTLSQTVGPYLTEFIQSLPK